MRGPFLYAGSYDDIPRQHVLLVPTIGNLDAWCYQPCDRCGKLWPEHTWLVVELSPDRVVDCSERPS